MEVKSISMCNVGQQCIKRESCYRYRARPKRPDGIGYSVPRACANDQADYEAIAGRPIRSMSEVAATLNLLRTT